MNSEENQVISRKKQKEISHLSGKPEYTEYFLCVSGGWFFHGMYAEPTVDIRTMVRMDCSTV